MSSPFQTKEPRAKLLLWSLAILFAGIFFYLNADKLILDLTNIAGETEFPESVDRLISGESHLFRGDSDNDGLENSLEFLFGGDIDLEDTDGDGFSDYEEFLSGYSLSSAEPGEITQEQLTEFFTLFDNQYTAQFNIDEYYYQVRVRGLIEEGRMEEAIALLDSKSITFELFEFVIAELLGQENYAQAKEVALIEKKYYPENDRVYFNLGYTSQWLEQWEEAEEHYLMGELLDSQEAALYNNLGILVNAKGETDKAIQYFSRAIELDPKRELYQQNLEDVKIDKEANNP